MTLALAGGGVAPVAASAALGRAVLEGDFAATALDAAFALYPEDVLPTGEGGAVVLLRGRTTELLFLDSDGREVRRVSLAVPLVGGELAAVGGVIGGDARLFVSGTVTAGGCPYLLAYRADGTVQQDFGELGTVIVGVHRDCDEAEIHDVVVERDGRVFVLVNDHEGVTLASYTAEGRIDRSFGADGAVRVTDVPTDAVELSLTQTGQGGLLVSGSTTMRSGSQMIRYSPTGEIDRAFNGGKPVVFPGEDSEPQVTIAANDHIDAALAVSNDRSVLRRYTPSGLPDENFGLRGSVEIDGEPERVLEQPDGSTMLVRRVWRDYGLRDERVLIQRVAPDGRAVGGHIAATRLAGATVTPAFGRFQFSDSQRFSFVLAWSRPQGGVGVVGTVGLLRRGRTRHLLPRVGVAAFLDTGQLDRGFGADPGPLGVSIGRPRRALRRDAASVAYRVSAPAVCEITLTHGPHSRGISFRSSDVAPDTGWHRMSIDVGALTTVEVGKLKTRMFCRDMLGRTASTTAR